MIEGFSAYTAPVIILATGVGGSSLIASVLVWTSRKVGALVSMVAGLFMARYIVVEAVMLGQGISWIESLYLGLGLLICG